MSNAPVFPPDAVAPWAEVVPDTGPMTVDDLMTLPDDGWQYELVEGSLVRMPPESFRASQLAAEIMIRIGTFVKERGLGAVTGEAGGYNLGPAGQKNTVLAPDVGFISANHLPPHVSFDPDRHVPFAPDLAVEVASPSQHRPEMAAKAQRYLAAGTRLVWIVWPRRRQIDVWRPGDTQPSRTLEITDSLDGLDVVPGFTCPIAELFR